MGHAVCLSGRRRMYVVFAPNKANYMVDQDGINNQLNSSKETSYQYNDFLHAEHKRLKQHIPY
eukprot:993738-Amphidinium_carterae.2